MNKRYTILHISDLHKSPNTCYDNLFESLCVDCEHYMADGIEKPEIIVVSGDLVEGSRNTEVKKAEEENWLQYEEVTKFLDKLCCLFFRWRQKTYNYCSRQSRCVSLYFFRINDKRNCQ